jgi:N-acetylglutamate synthase-like GNAT family acetyltransferase
MIAIVSRPIAPHEREAVIAFLKREGYSRTVAEGDRFFISEHGGEIFGVVRLSRQDGALVLRGMRVRSDVQRQGVGTQLLYRVVLSALAEACYCIPYRWLIPFYAQAGFREVTATEVPEFLASRHLKYTNDGLDVVMMCRPAD